MRPIIFSSSARQLRITCGLDRRYIHTTPQVSESVKEKISSMADKVNKKVGKGLASAIDAGEKATEKTKEALGETGEHATAMAKEMKQDADRGGHKAKQAGHDVLEEARKDT